MIARTSSSNGVSFDRLRDAVRRACLACRPGNDGLEEDAEISAELLAQTLRTLLDPGERIVLAAAAMKSLDRSDAIELAAIVTTAASRGLPLTHEAMPPGSLAAEMASWADTATRPELVAVAAAALQRLPGADRRKIRKALA